jgi:iron complex transport system ATP-binding protein
MVMSLQVEHLSFGYDRSKTLLNDISFTVSDGETLCVLGPNGAGKTSLLRCLLGISNFSKGTIKVNGRELCGITRKDLARLVAYVPQSISTTFPFTIFDMVLMGRNPHLKGFSVPSTRDGKLAMDSLEMLGIGHLKDRPFNRISGGEQQLTLIARALTQESRILIMDEPTASLDYGNQIRILKIVNGLKNSGFAVVMTTHCPDHAFLSATQVAIMKDGQIVAAGEPHNIITSRNMSELYAAEIKVLSAHFSEEPGRCAMVCVPVM